MSGAASAAPRAWVVFSGETELRWARLLKPGFRHCFLALNDGERWLTLDPLLGYTALEAQPVPAEFDLIGWYRERGHRAIEARLIRRYGWCWPAPYSCVEAVKRALGMNRPLVLTPWRLWRALGGAR